MAVAQDADIRVELYALAHFPLLGEDSYLRHPTGLPSTSASRFAWWTSGGIAVQEFRLGCDH